MFALYLDNFRGFQREVILLAGVNFFVGENSSGKTSVLGLLKLISEPDFWYEPKFNSPDVKLGNFDDIVSACSKDRSYFSFGCIEPFSPAKKKYNNGTFLATFKEKNGLPEFYERRFLHESLDISIRVVGEKIYYRKKAIPDITSWKDLLTTFNQWTKESIPSSEYTELSKSYGDFSDAPLALILVVAVNAALEGDEKQKRLSARALSQVRRITLLAPIRAKPLKTYDAYNFDFSSEGAHIPYLIKKTLDDGKKAGSLKKSIEKFGKESGLFSRVEITKFSQSPASPFQLDIVLEKQALNISNVGYGVSQVLPVIAELILSKSESNFAIQQPEVHLHPRAQAALGDLLYELTMREKKHFIVETHSDFLIDRFRSKIKKSKSKNQPWSQIIFFNRKLGQNKSHIISISQTGELDDNQPKGYRDFFLKEDLKLLGY